MSAPSEIAHYRIVSKLGEGGMGAVYRATDTKLGRDVAIKVLPDSFANDPDRLARFTREAQVLASLNHPNIAAIYGVEERAIVMELVEGSEPRGPYSTEAALPLVHQLIDALEYAHEKGVVHRDLKPANLKVTPDGRIKVLDFGLAKALSSEPAATDAASSPTLTMRATMAGVIMGTAGYMAPEQARGQVADKRADIWAFGAVVYEMLTGKQLFGGPTVSDSLAAVLTREPDLDRVPAPFRKLVRLCLVKDARQRLRDIGDARVVLAEGAAAPAPLPAASGALRRLPWMVAGACVVCALAIGALWLRQPTEEAHAIRFSIPSPATSVFESIPVLSPDGQHLAFVTVSNSKQELWVRDLDSMAARSLVAVDGPPTSRTPVWSPDSRFLVIFADGKLKTINISGGPAVALCNAANPRGGSWSNRNVILFSQELTAGLMRIPAVGGGIPTPATELDSAAGENTHRWPWFLPDGRHFLYLARAGAGGEEKTAIWVGDLESKARRRVVAAASNAAYDPQHGLLVFLRENTLMGQPFRPGQLETAGDAFPIVNQVRYAGNNLIAAFSISANGVLAYYPVAEKDERLTWYDRSGKPVATTGPPGFMLQPAVSPDGRTVAVERMDATGFFDIWLHDLAHATDSRFTDAPRNDMFPVWSPDGNHVMFASSRTLQWGLYVKSATGTDQEKLLFVSPSQKQVNDWSHDGKLVIYSEMDSRRKSNIWVLPDPLNDLSSHKPYMFLATGGNAFHPRLSPDGKYLAYDSDESQTSQVYVRTFPGKDARFQISVSGGTHPMWGRDGKELFYIANDGKVMTVAVKSGAQFEHGLPSPLLEIHTTVEKGFDISPDGKRFLIVQPGDAATGQFLNVVVNWYAGVKK